MTGPILSLIAKEYHEQKWRCASLCAIGLSVVLFTMVVEPESVFASGLTAMGFLAFLGTVFIAMGVAAGERSSGTLELLRALPMRMPVIAAVKVLVGAATSLTPVLAVFLTVCGWWLAVLIMASNGHAWAVDIKSEVGIYADPEEYFAFACVCYLSCLSVYVWVTALGARQRTELRAGLLGAGVVIGTMLLIVFFIWTIKHISSASHEAFFREPYLYSLLIGINPLGVYAGLDGGAYIPCMVVSQLVADGLLLVWLLYRFGIITSHDNRSPRTAVAIIDTALLRKPRSSPFTAVIWKQCRDTLPMAALGLVVIAAFVTVPILESLRYNSGDTSAVINSTVAQTSTTIGLMLALVVGVGTFVGDYQTGQLTFWRSRPVNPRLWFWSKYVTGLAVVELTLLLPWLLSQLLTGWYDLARGPGYMVTSVLLYLLVYSVSVWMACLLRHIVYAGIIAMGIVMFLVVPPLLTEVFAQVSVTYALDEDLTPFFWYTVVTTMIAVWLATRAARREAGFVVER